MKEPKADLKRTISLTGLSANIINSVVGAGIFVIPAVVAAGLGSASILAYLVCAVLIILIMLCFAEVGSIITSSGGAYAYIETTFGKYAGFITAILYLVAAITSDAAIANALMGILGAFFPVFKNENIQIASFLLIFSGLAFINIRGAKESVGFIKMLTIAKVIPLLFIAIIGFKDVDFSNLYWDTFPSLKILGEVSLVLFFAFQGAEIGLSVSGEVIRPEKTIPRAIFLSVILILVLYILIQTVSQGVLGSELGNYKENPLGEVAKQIFGPVGLTLISIGAAVSMFGGISGGALSNPRVIFSASKDGVIPVDLLSAIHKKYATPHMAILLYSITAFLFATFGGFKQLAVIASASMLIIYLGVALAVIKLRRKGVGLNKKKTFRIPGGYTVPVLSVIIILFFLSSLTAGEIKTTLISIGILSLVYAGIYLYNQNRSKKSKIQE